MTTLNKSELEEDTIEASFEELGENGIKIDGKGDDNNANN